MRKPKLFQSAPQRKGNQNAFRGGAYSIVVTAVVLAILVATSQGGIQALSRSMFGKMLPDKNRSGEYFGFFDIFGKFSSVMGPALMGFVTQIATVVLLGRQSLTPETAPEAVLAAAQQEASPWGVLSVLLIFLVGAVLYFGVLPRMLKKEGAGK